MSQLTPSPKLKIVPDTGFYIAAALKEGYSRSYLVGKGTKFLTYQLYSSEAILLEVQEKLESDKFGFDRPRAAKVIMQIRDVVKIAHPMQKVQVSRDPDDDKIIECALEVDAEVIVSLDKDLLSLKEYEGIKIIHPRMLQYLFPQNR
ncbi:MAG TPA: putative toxin-antitoxin system toxin component, PIN family [Candidatus Saccharimonadales bacterium]|jgi:putative PIN family toxin of toxin-antitoxin system